MEDVDKITELYNDFKLSFSDSDTEDEYYLRTSVSGFIENLNEYFEETEESLKKDNSSDYSDLRKTHDGVLNDLIEYKGEIALDDTSDTEEILEDVRNIITDHTGIEFGGEVY